MTNTTTPQIPSTHSAPSSTQNNNTTTTNNSQPSLSSLKRMSPIPDQGLLQDAYEEGARDMQGRMELEVERRVRDQLSLRARVQASNEREAKARQEYENYENRLNEALNTEDNKAEQLETYVQSLFARQYNTPAKPLLCTLERTNCLECYENAANTTTSPIDCASKVEAFARCADGLRMEYVSRGMPSN